MLDKETKQRIDGARDILVGKVPDPKSQVEQITIALIYKFMDDMDLESEELGGERSFFKGEFEKYAWRKIFDPKIGGFEILNMYSEAIMKMNVNPNIPQLFRDIFKNAYLPYRDPETLKAFLKIIHEFNYDHSEKLGDAFEYLLSVLGSQGDAGQFRTPRHIIDFMVAIIDPKKDEVIMDPACGTAGFLISSYKHIIKKNSSNYSPEKDIRTFETEGQNLSELIINSKNYTGDKITPDERKQLAQNITGYDISPDMVRLSLVNMYLHGLHAPRITEYDTLTSEDKWNEYADVVLANPPFMSPKGGIRPHKRFSISSNRSEVLFVDYIVEHLTPNGRAAVIVPEGIIFQSGTAYKNLRRMLVKNYLVGVISLPAGVFQPYSGVKTSILWLDRTLAKKTDKILFVKIDNDGFDLGAQRKPIKLNDLPSALSSIIEFRSRLIEDATSTEIDLFTVLKETISSSSDINLSIERYKVEIPVSGDGDFIRLGDILKTSSGGTPSKSNKEYWENGTIPWLKSGEVAQGYIYISEDFITEIGLNESSAKLFPVNTVLVAMYGATVGRVGLLKFESATNQAVCGILPNEKVIPEYLYYLLKAKREYLISRSVGGAQPNISQTIIKDLLIPLPPLSVQEEIVAEIESYQKIIDGARQVVDNYKPRIDIDPEWEMVELGDERYFKIEAGGTPSSKVDTFWGGNINWATLVDLPQNDYVSEIASTVRTITETGLKNSSAKLIPDNSVIVSTRATIGRVAINKVPIATNQGFKNVILKNNSVSVLFLALIIKSLETRMVSLATGGTFKELSKSNFSKLKVPLPKFEIQQKIVDQIERERAIIDNNKNLILIFQQKIKDRIARVWRE